MFVKFKILQIKDIAKCDYAFRPWNVAENYFSLLDYKVVYKGKDYFSSREVNDICEQIFINFNQRVEGFKGHSLSVGDIIMFDDEHNTLHYVDEYDFKTIKINYNVI